MRLLQYKDLDLKRVKPAFAKVRAAIEAGDFKSPDVKKLHTGGYYRAKLDHSNRLLLQFARHGGETVCLALEVIENHAYDKSRFLRGAPVDEAKIEHEPGVEAKSAAELEAAPLRWLHATRAEFELLDKPIVFDDAQEAVRRLPAPVVLVGSAGSGKTAVTLAKLREARGQGAVRHPVGLPGTVGPLAVRRPRLREPGPGSRVPELPRVPGNPARSARPGDQLQRLPRLVRSPPRRRQGAGRPRCPCTVRGVPRRHRRAAHRPAQPGRVPRPRTAPEPARPSGARGGARAVRPLPSMAGRNQPVRSQPGRPRLANAGRAHLRLRRHRRGAGPHGRATRPGAGLPEGAGAVLAVRRLQPDRAPQLLQLGGSEDAVLAGPGRPGRAAPAASGAAGQLPQHAGGDRAGQHAAEDQAGPLRLDRP